MTATTSSPPRTLCLRCLRPVAACWCAHLQPREVTANVVLLQHPREARNPIGTARMAHLGIKGSRLITGVDLADEPTVRALLADPGMHHAVLYPAADARDADELRTVPRPLTVWVLDGTWWGARKLWNRNGWLRAMPAYRINPAQPGQYRIRKEPEAHCLSTVEAVATLLGTLEARARVDDALLRPFHAMVEHQLAHAGASSGSRHRRPRRPPRRKTAPPELAALRDNLLVVHAEGNGWPTEAAGGPRTELVHWTAHRLATGERFGAFVRSTSRAPQALQWLDVAEATLASALAVPAFHAAWRAFLRPTDVFGTWGYFPIRLYTEAGLEAPPHLNLQTLVNAHLAERTSTVEKAHAALGGAAITTHFPGRGGRRVEMLTRVVEALLGLGAG